MRWVFLIINLTVTQVWSVTPITNDYSKPENIFAEIRNITDNAQDKSFQVVNSTPGVADLREGELVIYQSSPTINLKDVFMFLRVGTTIYASPNWQIIKAR